MHSPVAHFISAWLSLSGRPDAGACGAPRSTNQSPSASPPRAFDEARTAFESTGADNSNTPRPPGTNPQYNCVLVVSEAVLIAGNRCWPNLPLARRTQNAQCCRSLSVPFDLIGNVADYWGTSSRNAYLIRLGSGQLFRPRNNDTDDGASWNVRL